MHKTLDQLLAHCAAQGFTFVAYYEDRDDADYKGTDIAETKEALEACDEMNLLVFDANGDQMGWFFIVNDAGGDPEEQIADYAVNLRFGEFMSEGLVA